jgi:hypothetical protein
MASVPAVFLQKQGVRGSWRIISPHNNPRNTQNATDHHHYSPARGEFIHGGGVRCVHVDIILMHGGVAPARIFDGQADGAGSGGHIGVHRVLLGGGRAVAKLPPARRSFDR